MYRRPPAPEANHSVDPNLRSGSINGDKSLDAYNLENKWHNTYLDYGYEKRYYKKDKYKFNQDLS